MNSQSRMIVFKLARLVLLCVNVWPINSLETIFFQILSEDLYSLKIKIQVKLAISYSLKSNHKRNELFIWMFCEAQDVMQKHLESLEKQTTAVSKKKRG